MSETAIAAPPAPPHPDRACPKCGDPNGFLWSRPRFVSVADPSWPFGRSLNALFGALRWECATCEFVAWTATADTPD